MENPFLEHSQDLLVIDFREIIDTKSLKLREGLRPLVGVTEDPTKWDCSK